MTQRQRGGNESTNVQVGSLTIHGVSFSDARQIAVDVMKSELAVLAGLAESEARERISNFANKLISKLERSPELLDKFREPRTQFSVRDAHLLHAKRGTDDIVDLSIDMLIEFISCRGDDFKSVVIDDAIRTIHSLTLGQIDSLSLLVIVDDFEIEANDVHEWSRIMSSLASPFIETATRSDSQLDYLAAVGCANLEKINMTFGHTFNKRYRDLSTNHPLGDTEKVSLKEADSFMAKKIKDAENKSLLLKDLKRFFNEYSPVLSELQKYFDDTKLARLNLRVIGKAIGTANLRRKIEGIVVHDDLWFEE